MIKTFTLSILLALICSFSFAGEDDPRLDLNPLLAPFYHGVASGDPLQDAVIIWTRVTSTEPTIEVSWEVSTDTSFAPGNIVASGNTTTNASKDCTVKIDVTGLSSNTFYFYRFKTGDTYSMIGRTKTAPSANDSDQLRFATVSCSSFQHGYFNAYDRIKDRNDIDAIFHLGDYVYEYGPGEYGDLRDHLPDKEMVELMDYRTRYSQYRLDPSLRNLHQQYPFITTWDDHESADNSYRHGAENHTPGTEGDWEDRLTGAAQAYSEWLPIRNPDPNDDKKIYRKLSYGNLADIFVLDTRIIGRDEQLSFFDQLDPATFNDTSRQLLGHEQLAWLKEGLANSTAKWKIIAQQVMVAPFRAFDIVLNVDQWDGYSAERARLFDFIASEGIDNVVVLTGDIHSSWAMDLPLGPNPYNPITGENSVAVEFVTTSVTSPGIPLGSLANIIKNENKHIKHVNLTDHGYTLLNLTDEKAQNDYYFVKTIEERDEDVRYAQSFYAEDGDNHITRTDEATESIYPPAILAPDPTDTSTNNPTVGLLESNIKITGLYPNPVVKNKVNVQFFVEQKENVTIQLIDQAGHIVASKNFGERPRGIFIEIFEMPNISAGSYILALQHGNKIAGQSLIKLQ